MKINQISDALSEVILAVRNSLLNEPMNDRITVENLDGTSTTYKGCAFIVVDESSDSDNVRSQFEKICEKEGLITEDEGLNPIDTDITLEADQVDVINIGDQTIITCDINYDAVFNEGDIIMYVDSYVRN